MTALQACRLWCLTATVQLPSDADLAMQALQVRCETWRPQLCWQQRQAGDAYVLAGPGRTSDAPCSLVKAEPDLQQEATSSEPTAGRAAQLPGAVHSIKAEEPQALDMLSRPSEATSGAGALHQFAVPGLSWANAQC